MRFDSQVATGRVQLWWQQAVDAQRGAAAAGQDLPLAKSLPREAAGALVQAPIEGWGAVGVDGAGMDLL